LARTNYSFEKRQRELAKKRKKEEKKAAKKAGGAGEGEELTPNEAALALAEGEGEGDATEQASGDDSAEGAPDAPR
jgi:hypothetical protein